MLNEDSQSASEGLHDENLIGMYVPLVHLPATLVSCSGDPGDGSRAVVIPCDRGRVNDRDEGRYEQGVERGWMHVD
jgi:hypothetical protein